MLTIDKLMEFAPRPGAGDKSATWDAYAAALVDHGAELFAEFGIDTALELQHFLAQVAHESGGFSIMWESGSYSADRLMAIFGVGRHSAKVTLAEARKLTELRGESRAKAVFERVYGLGNPSKARELGNIEPGDGYRFRGFGLIQVTGRTAHEQYVQGDYTALGAFKAALREWTREGKDGRNCNDLAAEDNIKAITRRINGGFNGYEDRKAYLAKAKQIWPKFPGADAPVMTVNQATQVSDKAGSASVLQKVAVATAATGAIAEAADPIAQATSQVTAINTLTGALATFSGFVKSHALLALIIGSVAVWWFGRHIIHRVIEDYRSGRYTPSREVKP